ncbi:MAG: hypothetical protein LDL19_00085 [Thiobacillus sp.]|nr:hypothetical protein [Thiobacillus sp.]
MSRVTVFLVRLGLLGLSFWLIPKGLMDAGYPVYYRMTGTVVEGEVTGFLAGRYHPSVQPENTAMRNGKRIARRPVYRYPTELGAPLTLEGRAKSAFTFSFAPYELGEKVTVVFPQGHPKDAYLFELGTLAGGTLFFGFGLLCLYIGAGGKF